MRKKGPVPQPEGEDAVPAPIPVKLVKATGYEMLGAFLREVSALILVLAPLDKLISEGSVPPNWWCGTFLSSCILFLLGISFEQVDDDSHYHTSRVSSLSRDSYRSVNSSFHSSSNPFDRACDCAR
jgi:hypothetical protein